MARTFKQFEPLDAYKLDLIGSVLGIVGVRRRCRSSGCRPVAWGIVAGGVLIVVSLPKVQLVTVLAVVGRASSCSASSRSATDTAGRRTTRSSARPTSPTAATASRSTGSPTRPRCRVVDNPLYGSNYLQADTADGPSDVLIIGAGGGNDVAAALAERRRPRRRRRDRPASSTSSAGGPPRPAVPGPARRRAHRRRARLPRAHRQASRTCILLALPDSLTLVAGQSSVRLESYLFTKEAIEAARDHLSRGWRVLDVQLLPRGVADRPATPARSRRCSAQPPCVETLSPGRRGRHLAPRRAHRVRGPRRRHLRRRAPGPVGRTGRRPRAVDRRPPVPLPAHERRCPGSTS